MQRSTSGRALKAVQSRQPTRTGPDLLPDQGGPAIDPNTACVACGKEDEPETMLICDSCQQGHHLACHGLATIPEEDEWVCQGCVALQGLQQGSGIVLESPQALYADGADPHLTQGLFKGIIRSLGPVQQDSVCSFRQVQAEMALAPEPGSLVFYSGITYKRLLKPPKASVQLAEQLYSSSGSELSTVILASNRFNMFGGPAAAASCATEAWCLDDASAAQHALTQPSKQDYLLHRRTKPAAGRTTASAEAASAVTAVTAVAPEMQPAGIIAQQLQPAGFAASQAHTAGLEAPQAHTAGLAAPWIPQMPALPNWYPMPHYPPMMHPAAQPMPMQNTLAATQPFTTPPAYPMQFGYPTALLPHPYHPMMVPFAWPYGPQPQMPGIMPPTAWQPASSQHWAAMASADNSQPPAAQKQKQQQAAKRLKQQVLQQEACRHDDDSAAGDSSDDDWIAQQAQVGAANTQVAKVVYKVLHTPRAKGSRMLVNPSLAKQKARAVCILGLPLWRNITATTSSSAAAGSISTGINGRSQVSSRLNLSPSTLKQKFAEFAAQSASYQAFIDSNDNRNLAKHVATLLQLLSVNDDPLTIEADIITSRVLTCVRMQGQRKTTLNNMLSHGRSGFRLLFGRCLQPGIECAPSTVKVGDDTLRIDLHSPLPDGAVTDFGEALQARGSLKREAQGCIRTFETTQLHLMYAWGQLLTQLSALSSKWSSPEYIPARILDQINRWCCVLLAWHVRGLVDNGRPSDLSLYHLGCFSLVLPNGHSTPLATLVLASLQEQQQHSLDEMLEAFRSADAVLQIKVPKCKQDQKKRSSNGNNPVDWLEIYRPLLPPELALFCPTRTIAFSMLASWYAKGAVTARLINVRRLHSSKAAPKRHPQPDFQAASDSFKVLTAGDIHSYIPSLHLLQAEHQSSSSSAGNGNGSNSDASSADEDNSGSASATSSAINQSAVSSSTSTTPAAVEQCFKLSHLKPSKGEGSQVLLKLRQLSGYDQRHSLQKDALQCGIPLELTAKLAGHSIDEAKRYAANSCYELSDSSAMPIKLNSPEWTSKDLVPLPLATGSSLAGVPVHFELFRNPNMSQSPAAAVRSVADPKLAGISSSIGFKNSVSMMEGFLHSYNSNPKLNTLLHEPVLGGSSTDEQLPVKLLRDIPGILHLRSGAAVSDFLSRLPCFSASGISAPAAEKLVHSALADLYVQLSSDASKLSAQLAQTECSGTQNDGAEQLAVKHYSQVTFGRLYLAWMELKNS